VSSDLPVMHARGSQARILTLPGIRTFGSARFRIVLAATLAVAAWGVLGLALVRQAQDPAGQFGIDFNAYRDAAVRMAAGISPYAANLLDGPFAAQGAGNYLYPPPLAQILEPIAGAPAAVLAVAWLLLQAVLMIAAVLVGLWVGSGARPQSTGRSVPGLEAVLWSTVACAWFLPVFDTLWKGNVSGLLALQVSVLATGGGIGGAGAATAVLMKVAPIGLGPLLLARRRAFVGAVLAAGVVVGVSIVLAPQAWFDYLRVLPNLIAGDATQSSNLSPWAAARTVGAPEWLTAWLRVAGVATAAAAAAASLLVARRGTGWHAAIALGSVAMLLLPAQLWYHYLCVLLPLTALAWGRASAGGRLVLTGSGAMITLGIAWLPLATCGAAILVFAVITVLWPVSQPDPARPAIRFDRDRRT
jgi:Glycosyltransferase family 87